MKPRARIGLALALAAQACSGPAAIPDLAELYEQAAQDHESWRNPIVVVPGILGSRLVDDETGRVVWGAFLGGYADPRTPDGARLVALPMAEGAPLAELTDTVRSDGALDSLDFSVLGLPYPLMAYAHILAALGVGGYRDEQLGLANAIDYGSDHYTCFQFDYDWRRDLTENARLFGEFLEQRRAYVREETRLRYGVELDEVKFDVVAHSMGGLLVRWYLRYGTSGLPADGSDPELSWAGAEMLERVILVGPPNAGSLSALLDMRAGSKIAPFTPRYAPAILGTMPAVYQLLPRERHGALVDAGDAARRLDPFDPELWVRNGWGLADPGQDRILVELLPDVDSRADRRRIALEHLEKCLARARRVSAALDRPADPPTGVDLCLFAGDAEPTPAIAAIDANGGLEVLARAPGDGTVLRSSALLDERTGAEWSPRLESPIAWKKVQFLFADHLGVTRDPAFTDNVLYLLLEDPRSR